jgi:hypothetical protein
MAWYNQHDVRFRGRLVRIYTRYARYESAEVIKGKPLDLSDCSSDDLRLCKLFVRWMRNGKIRDQCPLYEDE